MTHGVREELDWHDVQHEMLHSEMNRIHFYLFFLCLFFLFLFLFFFASLIMSYIYKHSSAHRCSQGATISFLYKKARGASTKTMKQWSYTYTILKMCKKLFPGRDFLQPNCHETTNNSHRINDFCITPTAIQYKASF